MGILLALAVILSGALVAGFVFVAFFIARKEKERHVSTIPSPGKDAIVASILFHVARLGGSGEIETLHLLADSGSGPVPITRDIDIASWADEYSRVSSLAERTSLLEKAVRLAVASAPSLPLGQYNALLELSFALGFQTDALARLRAGYRFDYIDHAKAARPRSADRSGGGAPLYRRVRPDVDRLVALLGLEMPFSRRELVSAYRRTAAVYHPDRFHDAPLDEQRSAAERFIETTEAYEHLLVHCTDD